LSAGAKARRGDAGWQESLSARFRSYPGDRIQAGVGRENIEAATGESASHHRSVDIFRGQAAYDSRWGNDRTAGMRILGISIAPGSTEYPALPLIDTHRANET